MKTNISQFLKPLLLSLVMPGLGHVSVGAYERAAAIFFSFALVVPTASYVALHLGWLLSMIVFLGIACGFGIYIFSLIDAVKIAKHQMTVPGPSHLTYFIIIVIAYGFVLHPLTQYVRTELLESYYVPSTSMSPSLEQGDFFFANKQVNAPGKRPISRGDIVLFLNPNNRTQTYVKRVVALPGDTLKIKNDRIFINERPLPTSPQNGGKDEDTEMLIPNGRVFVLGDNRSKAKDSRHFGTIPLSNIIGVAQQVFFSSTSPFERIGIWLDQNH